MNLFGLTISRTKDTALQPVYDRPGAWRNLWTTVKEPFTGAWQKNMVASRDSVLAFHAVFACMTLIASDIAKLRVKLVQQGADDIWSEVANSAYSPVLRRPNQFQNRIQFWENWMLSKLSRGNTYALKERDNAGVVRALHILDPNRVKPLVADDGSVFYELWADNLAGVEDRIFVPAREIIHDRINCLFHPLVGISPLFANALAATQGLNIQQHSAFLFQNKSNPGGILTAPGEITQTTINEIKEGWEKNFGGVNAGRVAVLGNGLKYEKMALTAVEGQLIEQLKWTAEVVCSTFHVPPYKIGVGVLPSYNNVESLNTEYYSQCLQIHIEAAELCLDEGLEMATSIGTEFDLDGLLRMDTGTQITALRDAVGAGVMSPNEARKKIDLKPAKGGDSPFLQQQYWSLAQLSERSSPADAPAVPSAPPANDATPDVQAGYAANLLRKELALAA